MAFLLLHNYTDFIEYSFKRGYGIVLPTNPPLFLPYGTPV